MDNEILYVKRIGLTKKHEIRCISNPFDDVFSEISSIKGKIAEIT